MIEARIECVCAVGFTLTDISVTLRKGEVAWVPESKARASADLRIAERAGAVAVRWQERCNVSRQPLPNFVRLRPVREPVMPVRPPVPQQADPAELARLVTESMRGVVQEEIQKALQAHTPTVVNNYTNSAPTSSRGSTTVSQDAEPMFIPSGLVSKDEAPTLTIASESSATGTLDDAAEALKVVRRKKKES